MHNRMQSRIVAFCAIYAALSIVPPARAGQMRFLLYEDFDAGFAAAWPAGWTFADANGGASWAPRLLGGMPGDGCVRYLADAVLGANDWFFTPAVSLEAGIGYTIEFHARVTSASSPHALSVWIGSAPNPAAMSPRLLLLSPLADTVYQPHSAGFSVASSADYYFGFRCVTGAPNSLALYVDGVTISRPENDLELILQLDKAFYGGGGGGGAVPAYAEGEAKPCLTILKNNGAAPATVNSLFSIGHETDPNVALSFVIVGPGGGRIPFQGRVRLGVPADSDFADLPPGASTYKNFDLNLGGYDFSAPGQYSIQAIYKNIYSHSAGKAWKGRLESAALAFQIP